MPVKLSAPPSADVLLAAYEKHADAMMSQPDDRLLSRVNFDFSSAVAVVLGAQPALLEYRPTIKEQLPKFPLVFIDDLDSIAHATLYVFMQTRAATTSDPAIAEKVEKAKLQRKILQADAASAVLRNLMDERSVELAPKGNGRLEIAQGLLSLCVAFRAAWSSVKGHTAVTEEMLTDCTRLGVELLAALGRDDNPALSSNTTPAAARWLRAASFFYNAYDQCRRAMGYVRWDEGDASDYTPALVGTRGPRAKAEDAGGDEPTPVTPVTPVDPSATHTK